MILHSPENLREGDVVKLSDGKYKVGRYKVVKTFNTGINFLGYRTYVIELLTAEDSKEA